MADEHEIARFSSDGIDGDRWRIVGTKSPHHPELGKRRAGTPDGLARLARTELAAVPDGRRPDRQCPQGAGHVVGLRVTALRQRPLRIDFGPNRVRVVDEHDLHAGMILDLRAGGSGILKGMHARPRPLLALVATVFTAAFAPARTDAGAQTPAERPAPAILQGVDHIPIAVRDLDSAAARYRALGFALKPGTPHANSIRNVHVKFRDGTELELITATEARDGLTSRYLAHLAKGDGPAYLALFAPATDRLKARLDETATPYRLSGPLVLLPENGPLGYLFFGRRNQSPTDREDHFAHANGAESLVAVWLAADDLSAERTLLQRLAVPVASETVLVPQEMRADVARLGSDRIVLLPGSQQTTPGRHIVGATLRVRNLDAARQAVARAGLTSHTIASADGQRLFIRPAATHGLWLELRAGR